MFRAMVVSVVICVSTPVIASSLIIRGANNEIVKTIGGCNPSVNFRWESPLKWELANSNVEEINRRGVILANAGNHGTAIKEFRLAADKGSIVALANLGMLAQLGLGQPRNFRESARLLRLAADGGDPIAMIALGVAHAEGQGVEPNPKMALELFERSAMTWAAPEAKWRMAYYFFFDVSSPSSQRAIRERRERTYRVLRDAANGGHRLAMLLSTNYSTTVSDMRSYIPMYRAAMSKPSWISGLSHRDNYIQELVWDRDEVLRSHVSTSIPTFLSAGIDIRAIARETGFELYE